MKFIYSLVAILAFTFAGFSQKGVYVKYDTEIDASGEEGDMMVMMMNGSTMEVASSAEKTYTKAKIGTMMTMEMQMDISDNEMTMYMTGMMGQMAFKGNPDDMMEEGEEKPEEPEIELVDETKVILGIKCMKAVIVDDEVNQSIFWYTEDFNRPKGMDQMPNGIPGLCLQFEVVNQGMTMRYTAVEFDDKANMDDYKVVIPADVDIQSLEDMKNMGMGGM